MGLKKRTKVSADFNMSSLTDIVFLLLIFFMLTSSIVSPMAINLKLPNSSRSKPVSSDKPMIVKVDAQKAISFNDSKTDIEGLKQSVYSTVGQDSRAPEDITIILDIHPEVDAQTLVSVVDVMNDIGVKMILATKKEE